MITSNLTDRERECFLLLCLVHKPRWGMGTTIAACMGLHPNNVYVLLNRLVESGHVRKIRRGVYVRTQ